MATSNPSDPEPAEHSAEYDFGPFRFDAGQKLLFRGKENVALEPKVAETLRVLLERRGQVVAREELMREVWPDTHVEESGLARNISQLRKALGEEQSGEAYIATLPKRGYRFVAEVSVRSQNGRETPAKPARSKKRLAAGIALSCLLAFLALLFVEWQFYRPSRFLPGGKPAATVAVIPFRCTGTGLDCGAFSDGLNDLLTAQLAKSEGVGVLSPSTVASYQHARLSMAFMARVLGLDARVEGSVQQSGGQVRITARLIDTHNAAVLWSDSYDAPAADLAGAQEQTARVIAGQVAARLMAAARH